MLVCVLAAIYSLPKPAVFAYEIWQCCTCFFMYLDVSWLGLAVAAIAEFALILGSFLWLWIFQPHMKSYLPQALWQLMVSIEGIIGKKNVLPPCWYKCLVH